jgi:pilus assembly protein CpaC
MMARKLSIRLLLVPALLALAGAATATPAFADEQPVPQFAPSEAATRFVPLGIGKSVVVDLPRDAKDVLVANPQIANAVVRSARRAYLIGVAVGQTNVFFFDAEGRQIAGFDIAVTRDLNGVRAAIKQILPHANIMVEGVADGVMLTGTVSTPDEAQQAYNVAARLVGSTGTLEKVVNALTIRGRDQVMLKVTVAEVQRDVIKQLGIDLNGSLNYGTAVVNFNTDPVTPFSVTGQPLSFNVVNGSGAINGHTSLPRVATTIRAMERAGVIRTLAEPNLSAISGENASFLAGGEFPILAGYSCSGTSVSTCVPTIQFKKFGVSLNFTPVVLSEGRISLKVMTEVSELSTEGSFTTAGATIPSIKTRRADTTLEIPSGGSLAMAGLIQEQTKQQFNGLPGLMQVPILGTLFKSREYVNRQTELMVLVTPYVVRAVAQKELSRPDDGFVDATDPASVLLGRLNRIYGVNGCCAPSSGYHGTYGFILD